MYVLFSWVNYLPEINNHVALNISYPFLTLSLSMRLLCENYTGPVF